MGPVQSKYGGLQCQALHVDNLLILSLHALAWCGECIYLFYSILFYFILSTLLDYQKVRCKRDLESQVTQGTYLANITIKEIKRAF